MPTQDALRRCALGLAVVLVAAIGVTSCNRVTVLGGLMLSFNPVAGSPDRLLVRVASLDGSTTYFPAIAGEVWAPYQIPSQVTLPTTLAVVSDGNPASAVTIEASLYSSGALLVQASCVRYVPTDRVDPVDVFRECLLGADAGLLGAQASGDNPGDGGGGPSSGFSSSSGLPSSSGSVSGSGASTGSGVSVSGSPASTGSSGMSISGSSDTTCSQGKCMQPPSCLPGGPGLTNCGPGDGGSDSCCTSLPVTGGAYYRTYDPTGPGPDGGPVDEADPASVSTFRFDKYLVTVGRFRQFVNAWRGGWTPPQGSGKHSHLNGGRGLVDVGASADAGTVFETGWQISDDVNIALSDTGLVCEGDATWTPGPGAKENLPITCASWSQARAFCIWDGGFLPSEAEWEYVAAGGAEQREYPWGAADPGDMSQYAIYGCYYPNSDRNCTGAADFAPVGTAALGAGRWGQLDLEGEVTEWNLDWYNYSYVNPCTDCAVLTQGDSTELVVRGCAENSTYLLPSQRESFDPSDGTFGDIGFRCARAP